MARSIDRKLEVVYALANQRRNPASRNRAWRDGCGKDSNWKSYQLSHQFIRMHYKFRIGISAEFMQIHALPLAIWRDAVRDDVT